MSRLKVISMLLVLFVVGLVGTEFLMNRTPQQVNEIDPYGGVLRVMMADGGQGSCFVVAKRNDWFYAITARHVALRLGADLAVDEEFYSAEVVRISTHEDVALIRFQSPETYPIYTFAEPVVGADCITVGWSSGSRLLYKGTIVSLNLDDFVVANGGVFPGCSGGALFDSSNRVLGVTVALYSGFDSTALYVPARFAQALIVTIP